MALGTYMGHDGCISAVHPTMVTYLLYDQMKAKYVFGGMNCVYLSRLAFLVPFDSVVTTSED